MSKPLYRQRHRRKGPGISAYQKQGIRRECHNFHVPFLAVEEGCHKQRIEQRREQKEQAHDRHGKQVARYRDLKSMKDHSEKEQEISNIQKHVKTALAQKHLKQVIFPRSKEFGKFILFILFGNAFAKTDQKCLLEDEQK